MVPENKALCFLPICQSQMVPATEPYDSCYNTAPHGSCNRAAWFLLWFLRGSPIGSCCRAPLVLLKRAPWFLPQNPHGTCYGAPLIPATKLMVLCYRTHGSYKQSLFFCNKDPCIIALWFSSSDTGPLVPGRALWFLLQRSVVPAREPLGSCKQGFLIPATKLRFLQYIDHHGSCIEQQDFCHRKRELSAVL